VALPFAPGEEPEPASFAPVLFAVPERLIPLVEGPLPAAPGEEPEPASFGPVLFNVPDRLVPEVPEPPSAAMAVVLMRRVLAIARIAAFIEALLEFPPVWTGRNVKLLDAVPPPASGRHLSARGRTRGLQRRNNLLP
jgi:hypothetical protein